MSDWPEKIVYVCSAGRGMKVNRMPMRLAAQVPGRVVGVVILVGAENMKSEEPRDKSEAIRPAQHLEDQARKELGLPEQFVRKVNNDPNDMLKWIKAFRAAERIAANFDGVEIVFNITGGTKDMVAGAIIGALQYSQYTCTIKLISVSKRGQLTLVELADTAPVATTLPNTASDSFSDYLASYGLQEADATARINLQKWSIKEEQRHALKLSLEINEATTCMEMFGAIYDSLPTSFDERKISIQSPLIAHLTSRAKDETAGDAVRYALEFSSRISGVEVDGQKIKIASPQAYKFLRGGWLEALVYMNVRHALNGKKLKYGKPELFLSMHRRVINRTGNHKTPRIREMDVSVFYNDMLVPIECKATRSATGQAPAIRSADADARDLSGPGTPSFIVAPLIFNNTYEAINLRAIAEQAGVTALIGWAESAQIGKKVVDFLEAN